MPDARRHRGPHPSDAELFGERALPALRSATADLSWLLGRVYATTSSTALVGDRHALAKRQRGAVARCAASDASVRARREKEVAPEALRGTELWIDGYNVLTTVEAALAGGVVLRARDGCLRDVASVHGSWRRVEETEPALRAIGAEMAREGVARAHWLLDRPISNSGRLRALLLDVAAREEHAWEVSLVTNPDPVLAACEAIVVTSDSVVLDACRAWTNLAARVVATGVPSAWRIDLSGE